MIFIKKNLKLLWKHVFLRVIIEPDFYIFTNNCKTVIKPLKMIPNSKHSKGVEGVGLGKAYIFCLIDVILLLKCGEGGNVQGGWGEGSNIWFI